MFCLLSRDEPHRLSDRVGRNAAVDGQSPLSPISTSTNLETHPAINAPGSTPPSPAAHARTPAPD